MRSLYEILEIKEDATNAEIKNKYRELAKKYHPDRHSNLDEKSKKEFERKFVEVSDAYSVLYDTEKRKEYDVLLKRNTGRTKREDRGSSQNYSDINDMFSKNGMNNMFGNYFNQNKNKENKEDKKMKEKVNNMFDSFFTMKKGGK